jgi:hypothetical protein
VSAASGGHDYNQGSKFLQENPKENQGKKLAFPCFSLAESGLFKGLQRIQIKNLAVLPLASRVVSKTDQRRKRPLFLNIKVSYHSF